MLLTVYEARLLSVFNVPTYPPTHPPTHPPSRPRNKLYSFKRYADNSASFQVHFGSCRTDWSRGLRLMGRFPNYRKAETEEKIRKRGSETGSYYVTVDCMYCGLCVLWIVCTVDCTYCGLYIPWIVCTVDCMYCELYVLWFVCTVSLWGVM